jgi:hypothetical protein
MRTMLASGLAVSALASSARAESPPNAEVNRPGADWVEIALVTDEPHVSLYAKEPRKVVVDDEVGDSWAFVCDAPCGLRVDPRHAYRVMGDTLVPSIEFNLAPGAGRVALRVHPAHTGTHAIGTVLAASGALVAFAGVLFFLVDAVEHAAGDALGSQSATAQSDLYGSASMYGNIGIGLVATGAVLGATSLIFLLSGKTGLTPTDMPRPKAAADRTDGVRVIPLGFAF